jgi:DNA-binding transcriptional ArsR family regulator
LHVPGRRKPTWTRWTRYSRLWLIPAEGVCSTAFTQKNGQSLNDLCDGLEMTRQAVTQHLSLLEQANLVAVRRHGREKLHFLNPVPVYEIYARWIRKFEQQSLSALHDLKANLERKSNEK